MPILRNRMNQNQFRKVYPGIRKKPEYMTPGGGQSIPTIELGSLTFTGETAQEYTFTETYTASPVVIAAAVDTGGDGDGDINIWISAISSTTVTISASATFTGKINLMVAANS